MCFSYSRAKVVQGRRVVRKQGSTWHGLSLSSLPSHVPHSTFSMLPSRTSSTSSNTALPQKRMCSANNSSSLSTSWVAWGPLRPGWSRVVNSSYRSGSWHRAWVSSGREYTNQRIEWNRKIKMFWVIYYRLKSFNYMYIRHTKKFEPIISQGHGHPRHLQVGGQGHTALHDILCCTGKWQGEWFNIMKNTLA